MGNLLPADDNEQSVELPGLPPCEAHPGRPSKPPTRDYQRPGVGNVHCGFRRSFGHQPVDLTASHKMRTQTAHAGWTPCAKHNLVCHCPQPGGCVSVCVRVRVHVCACVCTCVCVRARVLVWSHVWPGQRRRMLSHISAPPTKVDA